MNKCLMLDEVGHCAQRAIIRLNAIFGQIQGGLSTFTIANTRNVALVIESKNRCAGSQFRIDI